jgi:ketosteroid isomerase-like protein
MALTAVQKAEVGETIGRYCAAYKRKDLKGLLELFSQDINGYGAGADEVFRNRKEYAPLVQRDLVQASSVSLEFPDLTISGNGQAARVMGVCICTFVAGGNTKKVMMVRMTLVLENTGSRWLIKQIHMSVPNTGQAPGQAFSGE